MTPADLTSTYEKFHGDIYRYALKLSRDPNLAADITADVFARLVEQVARGGGPRTNVRSYLYETAYHLLVDHTRIDQVLAPLELALEIAELDVFTHRLEDEPDPRIPWLRSAFG